MPRKKKKAKEYAQVFVIFGKKKTGKSEYIKNVFLPSLHNKRVFVVTHAGRPEPWREFPIIDPRKASDLDFEKGIRQIHVARLGADAENLYTYISKLINCVVIFDDYKAYLKQNINIYKDFEFMLVDTRPDNRDTVFIGHSPNKIPPGLWAYVDIAIAGPTPEIAKSSLDIDQVTSLQNIQKAINEFYRIEYKKYQKNKKHVGHYGMFKEVEL